MFCSNIILITIISLISATSVFLVTRIIIDDNNISNSLLNNTSNYSMSLINNNFSVINTNFNISYKNINVNLLVNYNSSYFNLNNTLNNTLNNNLTNNNLTNNILTNNLNNTLRYAILIAGQSNAVGITTGPILENTGGLDEPDEITQDHLLSRIVTIFTGDPKTSDRWDSKTYKLNEPMRAKQPIPVVYGATPTSVSFGYHFAKQLLKKINNTNTNIELWIINAAYIGSSMQVSNIGTWQPNVNIKNKINHYNTAVNLYNEIITKYNLTALVFLYHQGESDIGLYSKDYQILANSNYQSQLYNMLNMLRQDVVNATQIPLLIGTLLPNLYLTPHIGGYYVYNAHMQVSKYVNNSMTINLSGITGSETDKSLMLKLKDNTYQPLHYNSDSQRKIGGKFLEGFLSKNIKKEIII